MIEFLNAVSFIFNSTYFKFDNRYFKQIFGMPMRSPLSPILADLVIHDLEKYILLTLIFQSIIGMTFYLLF